ncbi:MAG: diacylglycerol kinase family lipid kinase [Bacteroidales bacterium]|nr:diacylglycerol kinase family lipid kinase [Bacteroidales bacterium]
MRNLPPKPILFIVNPVSGIGKQKGVERLIDERLDKTMFASSVAYTAAPGHATEISQKAADDGVEIVVAVGGDGTVNEIVTGLVGTETALAIIPAGSGNGLARHLKIPMNMKRAMDVINEGTIMKIDTATINGQLFVNVAGVGFDASVAKKFAVAGKRGFSTYLRITANSYRGYEPKQYDMIIDGKVIRRRALLISFANSSQFGNNTSIDPAASVSDGFIDVCIVGKMPFWKTLFLAPLLFLKKFDQTRYVEIIRAKKVVLKRKKGKSIHLDGDPKIMGKELTMQINPLSLNVIVPEFVNRKS